MKTDISEVQVGIGNRSRSMLSVDPSTRTIQISPSNTYIKFGQKEIQYNSTKHEHEATLSTLQPANQMSQTSIQILEEEEVPTTQKVLKKQAYNIIRDIT